MSRCLQGLGWRRSLAGFERLHKDFGRVVLSVGLRLEV